MEKLIMLKRVDYKLCPFTVMLIYHWNIKISSLLCCKKGTTLKKLVVNLKNSLSYWKVMLTVFTEYYRTKNN